MLQQNSNPSIQDVKRTRARISAAVLLSIAGICLVSPAVAEDAAPGPKATVPIVTAPPLKSNPLITGSDAQAASVLPTPYGSSQPATPGVDATAAKASVTLEADEGAPWVLKPESRPLPLRFRAAQPKSSLYLEIPSISDARLMLPGRVADLVDHNRSVVSKYITDAIGVAAQARARQQDALENWITETDRQRSLLSHDAWSQYQFSLETRRELVAFRESISAQTGPGITGVVDEVKRAVGQLAPLVSALPTYELQKSWYNLMVQLKDGVSLYQTQVLSNDQKLLDRIDGYLGQYGVVARPAGTPPSVQELVTPAVKKQEAPPAPAMMAVQKPIEPAKPAAIEKSSSDSLGGLLVMGGLVALVGFFVMRLRKRKGANRVQGT